MWRQETERLDESALVYHFIHYPCSTPPLKQTQNDVAHPLKQHPHQGNCSGVGKFVPMVTSAVPISTTQIISTFSLPACTRPERSDIATYSVPSAPNIVRSCSYPASPPTRPTSLLPHPASPLYQLTSAPYFPRISPFPAETSSLRS